MPTPWIRKRTYSSSKSDRYSKKLIMTYKGRCWMHLAKTKWVANANQEAKNSRILLFKKY